MTVERMLLPAPKSCTLLAGSWTWPNSLRVHRRGPGAGAPRGLAHLEAELKSLGITLEIVDAGAEADLHIDATPDDAGASSNPLEAYELEVNEGGLRLRVWSGAGEFYGLGTLTQLFRAAAWKTSDRALPALRIHDEPDFPERGVTLDVARGKRPTLETLFELVERLSSWKLNRLQLYMEADFAYSDSEAVLAGRSPYTTAEIRALDAHCSEHFIELVPNQQSFGHLHAWLRHDDWRELAEVPEGVEHPFSREREPFSLAAAAPDSISFLRKLYGELLPAFQSRQLNVGLDETFDLGLGRSRESCEARGKGAVYLDHLRAVHRLASDFDHRIQFWGDIVLEHPELIPELPSDATALVWGYEADFPFEERLPAFAECGLAFQVCPGSSSWNSFGGRVTNALGNLKKAACQARDHGARGLLITDWGDRGHLQPLATALMPLLAGAAFAWRVDSSQGFDLETWSELGDLHLFDDPTASTARAWLDLGRVTDVLGDDCENGHALFFACTFADAAFPHPRIVGLRQEGLEAARRHVESLDGETIGQGSRRGDRDLLRQEWQLARDQLRLAIEFCELRLALPAGHRLSELSAPQIAPLRRGLEALSADFRSTWLARHRPGGLPQALEWLDFLRQA